MFFEIINVSKAKNCPVCGSGSGPPKPIKEKFITELCSREGKKTFLIAPKEDLNIDIGELASLIIRLGKFHINVRANLGITFTDPTSDKIISILKSGVMIAVNFDDEKAAYNFYREILVNGLGVNADKINQWLEA